MDILFVPPNDLLRHPIPNRLYHIAKRLAQHHKIWLLTYPGHPLAREKPLRQLPAREVTFKPVASKVNLGLYYVANAPAMRDALEKAVKEVDAVIHANIIPSYIATKLAKKHGVKAIYDYVDHYPESAAHYYKNNLLRKLAATTVDYFVTRAIRLSDAIVTPSVGLKAVVERATPREKIHVIPNGVDADIFKPAEIHKARKEIGLDTDAFLILLMGSIDTWLDVEQLLIAMRKAIKKGLQIELLVVGYSHGKYYYQQILALAEKLNIKIHTYSPQPYEKMPNFINASNVVVAPFKKDIISYATPLKIIETLACGKPIIATEISEFKLWFRKGVFYYNNSTQLEEIILYIHKNYDNIVKELKSYVYQITQQYSWDVIAKRYINLLR